MGSNEDCDMLLLDLATDIWRLGKMARGSEVPPALASIIERLNEDLAVNNVEIIDPEGQMYDKNLNYEVMFIEQGDGEMYRVAETVSPGIRTARGLIARPRVSLAPIGGQK